MFYIKWQDNEKTVGHSSQLGYRVDIERQADDENYEEDWYTTIRLIDGWGLISFEINGSFEKCVKETENFLKNSVFNRF